MTELNAKLISETFSKLADNGDYQGVNYYRDSIIGNNELTDNQVRCINIAALAAYTLAFQTFAIKQMREISAMAGAYTQ